MEERDILFDDLLEGFDPEKEQWDALMEAVMAGNVVPVIGPDIICEPVEGRNFNELVISSIASDLNLRGSYNTFSQLLYDPEFLPALSRRYKREFSRNVLYSLVSNVVSKDSRGWFSKPSAILERLLSLKIFPFVITTSFSPLVENVMKKVWGESEVKVLNFCNDPGLDPKPGIGDIAWENDMGKPTVYYMFGKMQNQKPKSFVLTDTDMLEFCKSWLSKGTRPENLCNQLSDKYLLMLGCGYSDWLFRFIWFCMNKTSSSKMKGLMAHDENTHESLVEYLRRIDTFLPENKKPGEIVAEIEKRVAEMSGDIKASPAISTPESEVFISYSRSDRDVAEALYDYLTSQGIKVWFDRDDLLGGVRFMNEIERAIRSTKIFMPIITHNINREAMDPHVYRHEWSKAIELQKTMGSRNFIIPVNEEGFDFYNSDIPEELKAHNAISYSHDRDFSAVLESVNVALEKLEIFRKYN